MRWVRGMRHVFPLLAATLLLVVILGGVAPQGTAAQDATPVPGAAPSSTTGSPSTSAQTSTGDVTAAQQELANRYAPIAMLKAQASNCDKAGEGYFPVTVDFLFDNPDIALKAKGDGDADNDVIIAQGITPRILSMLARTHTWISRATRAIPGVSSRRTSKPRLPNFGSSHPPTSASSSTKPRAASMSNTGSITTSTIGTIPTNPTGR
ncbi:MAG: hypothetical protein R2848_12340 [Thermomicrobiales bacterium]